MGKMTVQFRATNYDELAAGSLKVSRRKARTVGADGLVDTGAVRLYLQRRLIVKLGLRPLERIKCRTMSDRAETRQVYSPVRLEIQGRSGTFEVVELPDTLPNIIGQIPLEYLDWVVDAKNRRLIPNPEHKRGELADEFGELASQPDGKRPPITRQGASL
jgi:predicted aspartyl protease